EGLEDGDADAGALEGVLLAAGGLGRSGRVRVEDGDVVGLEQVPDHAGGDPHVGREARDPEEVAVAPLGEALVGRGGGGVGGGGARDRVELADDDRRGRPRDRADQEEAAEEDEGASPHPYLITASVLVSKKWMRSGTKASRIFSWGRAFTLGSTRATTDWPARATSRRISEPSGSTTSTMASNA